MKKYIFILVVGCLTNVMACAHTKCFLAKENSLILKKQGDCVARHAPCSTFKIAISLMGFDSGILADLHTPKWPYQTKYKSLHKVCQRAHDPSSWIKNSVIWYSQVLTQKLGMDQFKNYVIKFNYGNKDISGDRGKHNGLTHCWLSSSLQISGEEQIEFLEKLLGHQLPVSQKAQALTRDLLYVEDLSPSWKLYGKTGSGFQLNADSTHNKDMKIGWFVGWIEKAGRQIVFAHCIEDDQKIVTSAGRRAKEIAKEKLQKLIQDEKFQLE